MLSQRGPVRAAAPAGAVKAKGEAKAPPRISAKRMTFKDRHALETLPARIASLQSEVAKLMRVMEDPGLYGKNPVRFTETGGKLEAARAVLAAAEEQWLALEMLREELG